MAARSHSVARRPVPAVMESEKDAPKIAGRTSCVQRPLKVTDDDFRVMVANVVQAMRVKGALTEQPPDRQFDPKQVLLVS